MTRVLLSSVLLAASVFAQQPPGRDRLIAIFVIDGLRPDSISPRDTPTLARLRGEGVEYVNSHSVFPTVTRVNAATLATGAYPARHGIVGNSMFVAGVNPAAPFDTGDYTQLLKLESATGRAVTVETLAEILQRGGRELVALSSGSTGNGYLLNPTAPQGAGVVIHGLFDRGTIAAYPKDVSDLLIRRFGAPPPDPDDLGQMEWTDTVLREYVLPERRPDVVIDWMGPLDSAQHAYGVGSPQALEALQRIDRSLSASLARIEALGLTGRTTVIVTSDHGFAHHRAGVDAVGRLVAAGLKADRTSTDVIVASQSQSLLFYLPGAESGRIEEVVRFLQGEPWVDVVFTAGGSGGVGGVSGTFSLDLIGSSHPARAPDIVVSLPWQNTANAHGVPGAQTIAASKGGPLTGPASGHGGLSPWVVRNTFLAWGQGVPRGRRVDLPVSLADVAPTVLTMLGLAAESGEGRGRVLDEMLRSTPGGRLVRRQIQARAGEFGATLLLSTVGAHDYVDSGSRQR
jgi:arylsulfatase A-like enzyme